MNKKKNLWKKRVYSEAFLQSLDDNLVVMESLKKKRPKKQKENFDQTLEQAIKNSIVETQTTIA